MDFPTEIIGVDPGLQWPGFAALDPKTGALLRVASFDGTKLRKYTPQPSVRIHKLVADIMAELVTVPGTKVIGIEGAVRMPGWQTIERLGRFRQAVFASCHFHLPDFEHFEINPTHVKTNMVGRGRADKQEIVDAVLRKYRCSLSAKDDARFAEADAIAIAEVTWARWRRRQ